MLLLKIIGGCIVLLSSSLAGRMLSNDFFARPKELRELQMCLLILKNEINFLSNLLSDAFKKIALSNKGTVGGFFQDTVKNLENQRNISISEAWEAAVRSNLPYTALNSDDQEVLVSFGKMLGQSDVEGQMRNIDLTIEQLRLQQEKAEGARKKSAKLYRSLGLLGGAAVVILLF